MSASTLRLITAYRRQESAYERVLELARSGLAAVRSGRSLASLQEIVGMEGEVVTMQEIFTLDRQGVEADGTVIANIQPTGIRPRFSEKLQLAGIDLPKDLFERDF